MPDMHDEQATPWSARHAEPRFRQGKFCSDIALLYIAGELTYTSARAFHVAMATVESVQSLVIDFTACTLVDSSSVGMLLRYRTQYERAKRRLWLLIPEGHVRRSLEMMRLDRVFCLLANRSTFPELERVYCGESPIPLHERRGSARNQWSRQ